MTESPPRVRVTRTLPKLVEQRLEATYDVVLNTDDRAMTDGELRSAMTQFDALVPTVSDRIDRSVLEVTDRRVAMLANVGVGFSNIDIDTAHRLDIAVSNTPDVLTEATADIALLLILASTRGAFQAETKLRTGQWAGFSLVDGLGSSVQNKVLGVIGMGRIGQATARRAALALGMSVIYFNRSPVGELDFAATPVKSVEEVMAQADVVSIHVPGGGTSPVITASHLAAMKPTAHLVNTARGDVVDQEALVDALASRSIAGAGLDVYVDEPHVPKALVALDNVTLFPHIGSATTEVRTAMGMLAVDNLDAFFAGRPLPNQV